MLGITGGGQMLNVAKKNFTDFLKKIVEIATLQTSYMAIDECLKITNRRVNALEYIVVPRIEYVIKYIDTELQERAKEEKFKIKKILQNKKKAFENNEAIKAEFANADKGANNTNVLAATDTVFENDEEDEDDTELLFK